MIPVSYRVLGIRPAWPTRDILFDLWDYARWSMPKSVVGTAISRMDVLLLSTILTTGAAGQYRVAMNVLTPTTFVSGVIGSGVLIKTSETVSKEGDPSERLELGMGFASILAIPIFFGAVAMPGDIVTTIYGPQYRTAGTLLVGLAGYKLLETQTDQLMSTLSGFDRPDLRFYISVGVLVTNVGLGVALLNEIGIVGVVIATLVTGLLEWMAALYLVHRLMSFRLFPNPIRKQFLAGVAMFGVVVLLHRAYGVARWGDLLRIVSAGAVIYGAVLLAISPHLRDALRSLFAQVIPE
jgi:O-antigen/teichoic acid export membrane protein